MDIRRAYAFDLWILRFKPRERVESEGRDFWFQKAEKVRANSEGIVGSLVA